MANKLYEESSVQAIADAIRAKSGSSDTYTIGQMANAVSSLPSGGGVRTCRVVVGTSTAGWTEADCDYLCDGVDDQVEINTAISDAISKGYKYLSIWLLDGIYEISAPIRHTQAGLYVSISSGVSGAILRAAVPNITIINFSGAQYSFLLMNGVQISGYDSPISTVGIDCFMAEINNCFFSSCSEAIRTYNNSKLVNCGFTSCNSGIIARSMWGTYYAIVIGCSFDYVTQAVSIASGLKGSVIAGNHITGTIVDAGTDTVISANYGGASA